ncbi:probable GTP diphosphokinase CRSH1, chloroplastic [Selaginella moellendorffii]|uniref:probable GTP diphosphokinase CRSH1, chloroplastic n=1 Tax=Selaginella moellendorffii TaxID=88036 RepID=UPI000D1D034E|nr:probable GTP diphosphokinase CRSH1, chloroplastic [Selaginella moellendorffii]|eukprot:XP_002964964.2 probable GTP diphosphokinase CRSH1, chloroplastic [Selaginella moellendorffii]
MSLCTSSSGHSFPELRFSCHSRLVKKSQHLGTKFSQGVFLVGYKQSCSWGHHFRKRARASRHVRAFLQDGIDCGATSPDREPLPGIKKGGGGGASRWCSSSDHKETTERSRVKEEEFSIDAAKLPQVFQLLSAWDTLSERLSPEILQCNGSQLLLSTLKVALPALQLAPYSKDGRFQLSRALAIAYTLADLHMDAEVIASGILRVAMETEVLSLTDVQRELGAGAFHLLDDSLRVNQLACCLDNLDDENANMLRDFSLAYHDIRAMVVELASRLDEMRHVDCLPRLRQQMAALENMQLYAPLAHALGLGTLSQELEDMAFRILFPDSYQCVEDWLQSHWGDGEAIIAESIKQLKAALEADSVLQGMVESVKVTGRRKSRFSTMKKLLRDGRGPDQVYDILGLRVILFPKTGAGEEAGIAACYRAQKIVTNMWKEVPGRMKDYIAKPKLNGYSSLHLAVFLTKYGPWSLPMELQIRTSAMHAHAVAGGSSHALYKGGLTDPRQVENFKAVMLAAAKTAACRFQSDTVSEPNADHVFRMFDKNSDGIISKEEFHDVLLQLGADKGDTSELLRLLDTNTDGSVDTNEFAELKRQVRASPQNSRLRFQIQRNKDFSNSLQHTIQLSVF